MMLRLTLLILAVAVALIMIFAAERGESAPGDVPSLTVDCGTLSGRGAIYIDTDAGQFVHHIECGAGVAKPGSSVPPIRPGAV